MASLNLKLCFIFAFLLWRCKLIKGELNINICENVADHIFIQDINDCTKYFVCVDGQAISQQCRSGLFFDANLQACIASRQGCLDCPQRHMINVTLSRTCDKYVFCYYGRSYLRQCENNQQFNRETKKCDFAQNVDCVDDRCSIHPVDNELVYMPSTKSCENYYVCVQGQAKMLTCAEGLQFSTKCNCCDKAENVGCMIDVFDTAQESNKEKRFHNTNTQQLHMPTLIGVTKLVKCPPLGTFLYPYIGNPDYYYTCIDGVATMYACASGFQFDDKRKRCVNMNPELEVPYETDYINSDNITSLVNETSFIECPEFGALIVAHTDKTKYVLCVNGNATVFDCPLDHYFDEMENICRPNGELKRKRYGSVVDEYAGIVCPKYATFTFPHQNRQKFYLCLDGKATVFTCADGQYFDIMIHGCRLEEEEEENKDLINGTFSETISFNNMENYDLINTPFNVNCPNTGNTTLPHAQNNQYYFCVEGKAAIFTCPEGLLYNEEFKNCTEKENFPKEKDIYTPDTAANIICPKFGTFKYPHKDKSKYYLCIDGKTYILACSQTEYFDAELNICRFDESLLKAQKPEVLNETINIECPQKGSRKMAHNERHKFYLCINGMASVLACTNGSYYDNLIGACRPEHNLNEVTTVMPTTTTITTAATTPQTDDEEESEINCPLAGTFAYPHKENNKYYACLDGIAITLTCPEGLVFDKQEGICLKPFELIKPKVLNETSSVLCPLSGVCRYPHEEENKFYLCINGMGNVLSCPPGSIFNEESFNCQATANYTSANNLTINANETDSFNITCPKLGIFLYPLEDKLKYAACINGTALELMCPEEFLFDVKLRKCRPITDEEKDMLVTFECPTNENGMFPHKNKEKFYLCLNGTAILEKCSPGDFFDAETRTCRSLLYYMQKQFKISSQVECPLNGTYKLAHRDANKFYLCLEGIASIHSCAKGEIFNADLETCQEDDGDLVQKLLKRNDQCPLQGTRKLAHVDRNKYYLCIDGYSTTYSCARGDYFDAETETCREASSHYSKENNNIKCPSQGSVKMPHADPNKFYLCLEGTLTIQNCLAGDFYDVETETCRANVINVKPLKSFENVNCPLQGSVKLAHVEPNKFYLCLNGLATIHSCGRNQYFDAAKEICSEFVANSIGNSENFSFTHEVEETDFKKINETASGVDNVICPPQGSVKLPHADPNKFYLCLDGLLTIQSCLEGDFYDDETKTCRESNSPLKPLEHHENIKCPLQGSIKLPHADPNKFYLCLNGIATIHNCAKGDFFDAASEICREAEPSKTENSSTPIEIKEHKATKENKASTNVNDIKCPPEGTLKVPHVDPNKFYLCLDGLLTIQSCLEGDFYDDETKTCRESNSPPKPLGDHENIKCPLQGSIKLPHTDPNKFYLCLNGIATIHNCAKGDFFDAASEICREAEPSKTEFGHSTENSESNSINTEIKETKIEEINEASLDVDDVKCPPQGSVKLPHADTNKFYLCLDGLLTIQSCLEGDFYDDETKTCRESNSHSKPLEHHENIKCPLQGTIKLPHADPNKFYLCLNGIATIHNCAKGDFFDAASEICREAEANKIELSHPTENREKSSTLIEINETEIEEINEASLDVDDIKCPSQGSLKLPHADPNKFYLCLDGLLSIQSCLEGDFYDDETKTCRENNSPSKPLEDYGNIKCPLQGSIKLPHADPNKFYLCLNGIATIHNCAKGDFFDAASEICREAEANKIELSHQTENNEKSSTLIEMNETEIENINEASSDVDDVKCPPQGSHKLPHADPNKFYLCLDGLLTIQSCLEGDFYDDETKTCRESNSPSKHLEDQEYIKCPLKGSIKLPHVDPNKFYLCLNGIATIHNCAEGDFFDANSETCRESVTSEIQQTSLKEKVPNSLNAEDLNMETKEISTTSKKSEDNSKGMENNANEISTKSETFLIDCPPQGIAKFPHNTDLNKYYLCSNGIASIQYCGQGDFFDVESQTCRETISDVNAEQSGEVVESLN